MFSGVILPQKMDLLSALRSKNVILFIDDDGYTGKDEITSVISLSSLVAMSFS
jgi:hypothetical protein